jgi:hypothetical protein
MHNRPQGKGRALRHLLGQLQPGSPAAPISGGRELEEDKRCLMNSAQIAESYESRIEIHLLSTS